MALKVAKIVKANIIFKQKEHKLGLGLQKLISSGYTQLEIYYHQEIHWMHTSSAWIGKEILNPRETNNMKTKTMPGKNTQRLKD
eukprot:snap_masked-scaffold_4-processed-gene-21.70-mRNA-1 protein AED:1.00 eAED:1.00 QI:0/0/0/0/1/1/2/0/83